MALPEMLQLARRKLLYVANSVENSRYQNLDSELETVTSMLVQLSQVIDVDDPLNFLEAAVQIFQSTSFGTDQRELAVQPTTQQGSSGRPKFIIPLEILEFFLENNFKIKDIAVSLGVSKRTVERRLQDHDLCVRSTYSLVTDTELEEMVGRIVKDFPYIGYRTLKSMLMAEGHRVQEYRVRNALKNNDPEGVLFRRLFLTTCRVQRRTYSVRGPQALWHIDGNHKLIRWRFVVHGGVDGFSRLPVYLTVSNNNRSQTVHDAFVEAVRKYGLPQRVRSDKGGENVLVAEHMIRIRGVQRKPFIAGRSIHNQRIERLWRELWNGVTVLFYNLFYFMEDQGILQVDCELHLQVLHLVYMPLIQNHLDKFSAAMQRRPLRTEHNRSPLQLWLGGQVNEQEVEQDIEINTYGIDAEEVSAVEVNSVRVPETPLIPERLATGLEPLLVKDSACFRMDIFEECMKYIQDNI